MRIAALAAMAILASGPALAQAIPLEVRLSNFKFQPRSIELQAGKQYVLTLTNGSRGGHNFTAKEFFAAASVNPSDRSAIAKGTVEVPGESRRTIRFRAPARGTYKVKCTHTLHGTFGMRGEILVR
jgi:uncharacterized cupredoxin-like copper-binding protein